MNQRSDRDPLEELAEEFVARYRSGERPAVSEFARRRPELADEVRAVFPALLLMEDFASSSSGSQTAQALVVPDKEAPPEQLGDYRIIREIGRGGMGVVYEAEQIRLQRRVALKVLPHSMLQSENSRKRFLREARSAARLHHTNIVPVFGVGEEQGLHYYAMQFIEGRSLDQVVRELSDPAGKGRSGLPPGLVGTGMTPRQSPSRLVDHSEVSGNSVGEPAERPANQDPSSADDPAELAETAVGRLSQTEVGLRPCRTKLEKSDLETPGFNYWNRVAEIGVQVAEAIEHSHSQGILHRDVKPGNLILDLEGPVWLTDFGLARSGDDEDNVTATGEMVGTLRYSAPEQIEGEEDCRSDVYSLGVTLYELLALKPAFPERSRNKLAQQIMRGETTRLRKLDPRIPRDLETVIHKAIHRDPGALFQTAAEFAADLRRFLNREPIQARRV
ncbi:MAG: serine/threonine protein kinase, partial [Planctomycetes bacterium]|nr:serine/threonine protein kinase [Planctomycetota bacterium]